MKLPETSEIRNGKTGILRFKGYQNMPRVEDGAFREMRNLSGRLYPLLTPREPRNEVESYTDVQGFNFDSGLAVADNLKFCYEGTEKGSVSAGEKELVTFGSKILIWPDKKYYDTVMDEFGSLESSFTSAGTVTYDLVTTDNLTGLNPTVAPAPPESPQEGDHWVDTSGETHILKKYVAYSDSWMSVYAACTRISTAGLAGLFQKGDSVTISGSCLPELNGQFVLQEVGAGYVVVPILIDQTTTQSTPLTIARTIPDCRFLTVHRNRVFGCSEDGHEIYACKLGDPFNWNSFQGLSSDSYALSVGTPGPFTAACAYEDTLLFFKENEIFKLFGTRPANFQLSRTLVPGVAAGSAKSLIQMRGMLYYLSYDGVYEYGGGIPLKISDCLGDLELNEGIAGAKGDIVYLSALCDAPDFEEPQYILFTYDARHGLWFREDDLRPLQFAAHGNELYYLDEAEQTLCAVSGGEDPVSWEAVTGELTFDANQQEYITSICLRAECTPDARLSLAIQYDAGSDWQEIAHARGLSKETAVTYPLPMRCQYFKLRLKGEGDCKIYSLTFRKETGNDLFTNDHLRIFQHSGF